MARLSRGTIVVLLTLLYICPTSAVEIIHEEGRCLWLGQCNDTDCRKTTCPGKYYNLFNNGYHLNVTEDSDRELYDLIKEICPMYIGDDSVARVCCLKQQLLTLKDNLNKALNMLNRCPACSANFIKNFCITTCDPSEALFMNGTIKTYRSPSGMVYEYVEKAQVFLTEKFAGDLYNSCVNVHTPWGGYAMNLLCGMSWIRCDPLKWLNHMGDPSDCESPFQIQYYLYPNSTPIVDGITPLDDTGVYQFYRCNQSVGSGGSCSCSDCPSTCPPPPHFPVYHIPFKIVGLAVGSAGSVISTLIFIIALISALFFWNRRKSGYKPISSTDTPPSTYGATGTGQSDKRTAVQKEREASMSSSGSINSGDQDGEEEEGTQLSAMARCCQIGHWVEHQIQKIFYHWGRFVTKFWYLVLFLAIIISGALSFGLFFFTVTTDPVQLWSSPHSQARLEKDYFDTHFGPFYRTEQIIVKAKPGVEGPIINPPETTTNVTWTFGPVYNLDLLNEVLELQNNLTYMNVSYNDAKGHVRNITLHDICFSPLAPENTNCTIESILNYFQNDPNKLNMQPQFYYNSSYHIHYCTQNPFSTNETLSYFFIPCIGAYGGDIDPNIALGGFEGDKNGIGYNYDTATVLIITFVVNNHVKDSDNKMAMTWEKAFLDYLSHFKKRAKYVDIVYSAERSIVDEINRESETDIYTIAASYLLMFIYITIFLGHIRSISSTLVDMKLAVGFVGVLLVLFAVTSSLGFYSYMRIEASLIVLEVVPFLVLAVGVDNLFILVHSYERQLKQFSKVHGCNWNTIPLSEIIGRAVGEVAPSLLLTGLSETSAFLLGAVSIMPAVRTFSLYAGTAVFFNLLLQLSVFVAVLALDARRQLSNRVDIFCCIPFKGKFDPRIGREYLAIIMKYFANFILYPLVRPFILLFFGLTLTASIILMFRLQIGLNQNLALPKDSYLIPYFDQTFEYLHTGAPVYFVIKDGLNYTVESNQNKICSGSGCDDSSLGNLITIYARAPNESGIAESPLNWLDSYFAWISNSGGCCGYYNNTTPSDPTLCDSPQNGTECVPCIPGIRPNATEFREFLKFFLSANPNATCAAAGHAAFGGAVILEKDNQTVETSYIMTYHNVLQTSSEFINALKRAYELSSNVTAQLGDGHEVFPYSVFYVYYEQYLTIIPDMLENIGLALLAVFLVSFLLMGLNLWAAVMIIGIVASIILHMLGSMAVLNINANAVSLVNLVMTVGIAVEFCSHIVRWFVSSPLPTRKQRAHSALHHMGTSVVSGITLTKFLGVFVLLFAKSQLFKIYYFRMYMCMLLWGALHGLVLLPVLLSYVGPPYFPSKLRSPYNTNYMPGPAPPPTTTTPTDKEPPVAYAPPTSNKEQHYPPPTHPSTNAPYSSLYPTLTSPEAHSKGQQYPAATRPRDPQDVDEHSPLLN